MAITTLDGVRAGLTQPVDFYKAQSSGEAANVMHSLLYTAGNPDVGVAPSPGLGGAALTSYGGQIPFLNPVSGNAYLARYDGTVFPLASSVATNCTLLDRLWHNSGLDVTSLTAQTIDSVAWPARDRNGSTNGDGVFIGIEVSTATTNVAAVTTMSMSYTNSAGTSGRTATIASFPATAVAGTFVLFQLDAGDVGVRSIQTVTLGTALVTGAVHLVAVRPICDAPQKVNGDFNLQDAFACGFPRLYDNTVPFIAQLSGSTNMGAAMTIGFAHG